MSISVILDLGTTKMAVKKSNFDSVKYLNDGALYSFVKNTKIYIRCVQSGTFFGYLEYENFEKQKKKYNNNATKEKVTTVDWRLNEFNAFSTLILAENEDILEGAFSTFTQSGRCKQLYHFNYNGLIPSSTAFKQGGAYGAPFECEDFGGVTTHAGKFFEAYKNQSFYDLSTGTSATDIELIGEIALLMKTAGEKTAIAFQNFVLTGVNTTNFTFVTNQNYTKTELLNYKKGLERWLELLKTYTFEISKLNDEKKLYIYIDVMYRHNMLTTLTVPQRIAILKVLVEQKALMNWYWYDRSIGFVNKEDLAIYILRSVSNNADADLFLQKLVTTNVIDYEVRDNIGTVLNTYYITLYKLLFYRMDDYAGKDNFTEFVKELQRIVLLRNNIPLGTTPSYNPTQLAIVSKAQFLWREKGPKKNRVKYEILSNTATKIGFRETTCLKTELREIITAQGIAGASVNVISGYEEVCVESIPRNFELNHFDLVSIHFYNNPSFIDLSTNSTYVGQNFFTFAGFIDYLLEKESTKVAEDVFNAALFAVSLTVGFGELVAAVRTVNIARAALGLAMITSDSAAYLVGTTNFHNYIITTYGTTKGNQILGDLTILTTIASLGTNAVAGSGILKAYSREEGLKLVGTGEAILKDSKIVAGATPLLNANEVLALEEAIKKIKNEMYAIRNLPEAVETIVNTKASVFFGKFVDLESEINSLSQANKLLFYNKFVNISESELIALRSQWLGLNEIARIELLNNSDVWLKYLKVRTFLVNNDYPQVAKIFGKSIVASEIPTNFPNLRYIDLEDDIANTIILSNRTDDIALINQHYSDIPVDILTKVKNHYYIKEHLIFDGQNLKIGRFGRTAADNAVWEDAINGFLIQDELLDFKVLIAHEYIEAKLMDKGLNFRSYINPNNQTSFDFGAHFLSPEINAEMNLFYPDVGRIINPPLPNLNTFDNLDEIVDWYINFYKL